MIKTAMKVMLDLRNFDWTIKPGKVIAGVSLGFQCAFECAHDRSPRQPSPDTSRIRWRRRLSDQAFRTTCRVRGARRQRDCRRTVRVDKAPQLFADAPS